MPNTGSPNTAQPGAGSDRVDFETALTANLKANGDLANLIADRVYPLVRPEARPAQAGGKLPCLVYAITSTDRGRNLNGPNGIAVARVLIDCRGKEYADVKRLKDILRQYDGFSGYLHDSLEVLYVWFDDETDEHEAFAGGGGPGTFHLTLSFRFKYREPILERFT